VEYLAHQILLLKFPSFSNSQETSLGLVDLKIKGILPNIEDTRPSMENFPGKNQNSKDRQTRR